MAEVQVTNIAALKAIDTTGMSNNTHAEVFGYYSSGDKGGGSFYFDSASTETADDKLVFAPDSPPSPSTGRWKRILFTNEIDVRWFGGKTDGTDQTSLINDTLAMSSVSELVFDGGDYTISGTVTVPSGKKLVFRNKSRIIGSGSGNREISGGIIICHPLDQCLGTNLTVSNLENEEVSVMWFGATPDYNDDGTNSGTATDNHPMFTKALNSMKNLITNVAYQRRCKLHIPKPVLADKSYYLAADTWYIDSQCEVYGDGYLQTKLIFPTAMGKPAIWVRFPVNDGQYMTGNYISKGATDAYLHDFGVYGAYPQTPALGGGGLYDNKSHGIRIDANNSLFERVTVQYFRGNNWDIFADVTNIPYTNANNCTFRDIKGNRSSGSGIRFKGGDSNNCRVYDSDFSNNARWGVNDDSFLGNKFDGIHTSSNGYESNYNKNNVYHNGRRYAAIQPMVKKVSHNGNRYTSKLEHLRTAGSEPGVGGSWATYWDLVSAGGVSDEYWDYLDYDLWKFVASVPEPGQTTGWAEYWEDKGAYPAADAFAPQWTNTSNYAEGGGFISTNGNQRSVFTECYSELDQHNATNRGASLSWVDSPPETVISGAHWA